MEDKETGSNKGKQSKSDDKWTVDVALPASGSDISHYGRGFSFDSDEESERTILPARLIAVATVVTAHTRAAHASRPSMCFGNDSLINLDRLIYLYVGRLQVCCDDVSRESELVHLMTHFPLALWVLLLTRLIAKVLEWGASSPSYMRSSELSLGL